VRAGRRLPGLAALKHPSLDSFMPSHSEHGVLLGRVLPSSLTTTAASRRRQDAVRDELKKTSVSVRVRLKSL
jgi:hypothetical protein